MKLTKLEENSHTPLSSFGQIGEDGLHAHNITMMVRDIVVQLICTTTYYGNPYT